MTKQIHGTIEFQTLSAKTLLFHLIGPFRIAKRPFLGPSFLHMEGGNMDGRWRSVGDDDGEPPWPAAPAATTGVAAMPLGGNSLGTNKTNDNVLRLRRFRNCWKALGE